MDYLELYKITKARVEEYIDRVTEGFGFLSDEDGFQGYHDAYFDRKVTDLELAMLAYELAEKNMFWSPTTMGILEGYEAKEYYDNYEAETEEGRGLFYSTTRGAWIAFDSMVGPSPQSFTSEDEAIRWLLSTV